MPIERPLEQGRNEAEVGSAAPEVSSRSISGQYPDMHPDTASAAATGIALRRHFVPAGVESLRRGRVGACAPPSSRARRARSSSSSTTSRSRRAWSQLATNVVVSKYFRGPLGTPEREHSVRQLIGRVVAHDPRLGRRAGLLRHAGRRRRRSRDELTHLLVEQKASFNSPVWFNVGIEPQAAVLGLLHPLGRRHDGVDPRLVPQRRHHLQRRLGLGREPVADPLVEGAAGRRRHRLGPGVVHEGGRCLGGRDQVGRQDAPRGQDGGARTSTIPTSSSSSAARKRRRRRRGR